MMTNQSTNQLIN